MAIEQKLDLKAQQSLIMTPQLREAISMLQLNNIELQTYLEQELEHNPFLELAEGEREEAESSSESPDQHDDEGSASKDDPMESAFDAGTERTGSGGDKPMPGEGLDSIEGRIADKGSLRDHLMQQLAIAYPSGVEQMVGAFLIDHLDSAGYLRQSLDELSGRIGCKMDVLMRVLSRIKQFDPTGVFAADLPDCLALQLDEEGVLTNAAKIVLENLHMLADGEWNKLAKLAKIDQEDLAEIIADIRACNPKPAADYDHVVVQTALPDAIMKRLPKHQGGGWKVELNSQTLPRLLVNREYHAIIKTQAGSKADIKYVNDQLSSADWLANALDQRAQTILKVCSSILEQQEGFFLFGVEFLKPLTLREVAEEIGMHESTVSRITMNKFMGTPRGLFPLKYFFDSGVSGSGGVDIAAEAVKAKIKNLIDAEDPKKILSDDKITELLKAEGTDIARRTVAKYREALRIPSSPQRRKQKRNL